MNIMGHAMSELRDVGGSLILQLRFSYNSFVPLQVNLSFEHLRDVTAQSPEIVHNIPQNEFETNNPTCSIFFFSRYVNIPA